MWNQTSFIQMLYQTLTHLNSPSIQVIVIKLVDGPLHVPPAGELHHALVLPVLVSVSVGDVARLAHQVLQILKE